MFNPHLKLCEINDAEVVAGTVGDGIPYSTHI